MRNELAVRDSLVRTRTRYVAFIKAAVRREGLRLSQGTPQRTASKIEAIELSEEVLQELGPILGLLSPLNEQIDAANERLSQLGKDNPLVTRLMTAPGVGAVTALAFVASLDEVARFKGAHQVEAYLGAYLGLVPSEYSASTALASGSTGDASPSTGTLACAGSWSRRGGASCDRDGASVLT